MAWEEVEEEEKNRECGEGRPQLIQKLRGARKSSEVTQLLEKISPRTDREFNMGIVRMDVPVIGGARWPSSMRCARAA